jgi:glyoxylase-like metal-dependent hydrolase (beta-lactamase superfamily II)
MPSGLGTGFRKKIMLRQKAGAGWRSEEYSSCSSAPVAAAQTLLRRRDVVAAMGAALLAPANALGSFAPFRRQVGTIELIVLSDGALNVPLSFMLPETPVAEAEQLIGGAAPIATNPVVVKTGNELVLIDAGAGSNFQPSAGKLGDHLAAAGIEAAQITKIVFTHAHADHLWGAIDEFDEERFPNATYIISNPEWDFWTKPDTIASVPDWLKPMAQAAARILKRIEPKVERREPGESVAAGLTYMDTIGHTPGHMSVMIESAGERLFVGADALTHPIVSFARPRWRIGSDFDHDRGVATRLRLLDHLAADRLPLIGFHLPWPGHGTVEREGAAFRFVPT